MVLAAKRVEEKDNSNPPFPVFALGTAAPRQSFRSRRDFDIGLMEPHGLEGDEDVECSPLLPRDVDGKHSWLSSLDSGLPFQHSISRCVVHRKNILVQPQRAEVTFLWALGKFLQMLTSATIPRWRHWSMGCRGRIATITSSISCSTTSLKPFPELEGGSVSRVENPRQRGE